MATAQTIGMEFQKICTKEQRLVPVSEFGAGKSRCKKCLAEDHRESTRERNAAGLRSDGSPLKGFRERRSKYA